MLGDLAFSATKSNNLDFDWAKERKTNLQNWNFNPQMLGW